MKQVTELIQAQTDLTMFNIAFYTTPTVEGETPVLVNILDPLKLIYALNRKYQDWKMYLPDWDVANISGTFVNTWLYWKNANMENIERMFTALIDAQYNPIDNYNRKEVSTLDAGSTTTVESEVKNKTEFGTGADAYKTTNSYSNNYQSETDSYSSTYDNTTTPKLVGKAINKPTGETYTTQSGTTTSTVSQDPEKNISSVDSDATTTRDMHGNIGVTTTQSMIEKELQLRQAKNLTDIVVDMFAHEHLILVGDD